MKIFKKTNVVPVLYGILIGTVNGMLGAGGGMLAVPALKKLGLEQKKAHSNAVAVILPITVISVALYIWQGNVKLSDAFIYIPGGLVGSLLGTLVLSKISPTLLKRIFGGFMVWAGVRLLFK